MESDRRSSFLFGRIFCDEPVSTSSENALIVFKTRKCSNAMLPHWLLCKCGNI